MKTEQWLDKKENRIGVFPTSPSLATQSSPAPVPSKGRNSLYTTRRSGGNQTFNKCFQVNIAQGKAKKLYSAINGVLIFALF